ncbi:hypothetical protein [Conyzicola sp.]|uniref:hypothetical protein n=1 Tax=Conyzicola sp. TaxID=1969404 RepID=UPI003989DB5E
MITLADQVPHRAFLVAMLARHYDPAQPPTVLITTDPTTPVADTIDRIIQITDAPWPTTRPTLVIGADPPTDPSASHARLATAHPAELLSVIDGYLRHPESYPAGRTREPARV